jgi:hypothetical protein
VLNKQNIDTLFAKQMNECNGMNGRGSLFLKNETKFVWIFIIKYFLFADFQLFLAFLFVLFIFIRNMIEEDL